MENGKTTAVPEVPGEVCYGSTEFHTIRPKQGIQSRWIAQYLLQHAVRQAAQRSMTGGVGQMRVPASFLESLEIPIPPTPEVSRIADALDELFSDLDAGVAALERVREKLTLYRASVLKAAVEGTLTAEWRAAHPNAEPASELLKRILAERRRQWEEDQLAKFKKKGKAPPKNWKAKYKEPVAPDTSKLPHLPEGWCWTGIEQVCSEIRNGYSSRPDAESGVPILRISAVRAYSLDLMDVRYLPGTASDYLDSLIRHRDLLFTRYNGTRRLVGVCAVVHKVERETAHPDKVIRARPLTTVETPSFIALAANIGASRSFLEKRIRTTAGQAGVSGTDIKALPVPLPPAEEQEAIVEITEDQLSVIDHLEGELHAKLLEAQSLRQSILRHAFTGQLVPQDPKDAPASELLKRIAAEREARLRESAAAKKNGRKDRTKRPGRGRRKKKEKDS